VCDRLAVSDNGWIDDDHCEAWLTKGFIAQVGVRNKPILLICDGHGSHCTGTLLLKAADHNIFILRLPPHCTHKLQPLDVGVLGPLQAEFSDNVDAFVTQNGHGIGKREFIEEYTNAHDQAFNEDLIQAAFKHCGIVPLNPNIFTTDDFAPAQAFSTTEASHFPSSYPNSDPLPNPTPVQTDADSDSDLAIATAQSDDESDWDGDFDLEGELDDFDCLNCDDGNHIAPRTTRCELRIICESQIQQLKAKDDEIADLRLQRDKANAHAVMLRRVCTPLLSGGNEKRKSRLTGTIDAHARVLNTEEALVLLKKERQEAEENAEYLRLREEETERQGDRIQIWKAIPHWRSLFLKLAERKRKQAEAAIKRAEKTQAEAEAKAARAAKKVEDKEIRDAAKQAVMAKKKEERVAEQERKQEEKRRVAEEKAIAKAVNAPAKRRRVGTTSGPRKKTKVSNEVQDLTRGQENDASPVALNRDCSESPPHVESTAQPVGSSPSQSQIRPHPKIQYTGPREDLNICFSDELRRATFSLPADQHQMLPPSDRNTNTCASYVVAGNPFDASLT
jgi:hypothetical protein